MQRYMTEGHINRGTEKIQKDIVTETQITRKTGTQRYIQTEITENGDTEIHIYRETKRQRDIYVERDTYI